MSTVVAVGDLAPGDVISDPSIVRGGSVRVDDIVRSDVSVTLICRPGRRHIHMLATDRVTLIRRTER